MDKKKVLIIGHGQYDQVAIANMVKLMGCEPVFADRTTEAHDLLMVDTAFGAIVSGNLFKHTEGSEAEADAGIGTLQYLNRALDRMPPFILYTKNTHHRNGTPLAEFKKYFKDYAYVPKQTPRDLTGLEMALRNALATVQAAA